MFAESSLYPTFSLNSSQPSSALKNSQTSNKMSENVTWFIASFSPYHLFLFTSSDLRGSYLLSTHSGRHKYFHNNRLMIFAAQDTSVWFNFLSMTLFILNQSQIENSFPPLSNKVKWTQVCFRPRMDLTLVQSVMRGLWCLTQCPSALRETRQVWGTHVCSIVR